MPVPYAGTDSAEDTGMHGCMGAATWVHECKHVLATVERVVVVKLEYHSLSTCVRAVRAVGVVRVYIVHRCSAANMGTDRNAVLVHTMHTCIYTMHTCVYARTTHVYTFVQHDIHKTTSKKAHDTTWLSHADLSFLWLLCLCAACCCMPAPSRGCRCCCCCCCDTPTTTVAVYMCVCVCV